MGEWGKSENEVELSRGEFSKFGGSSCSWISKLSGDKEKKASQFLFPRQKILDCFQINIWHLQSNSKHRNIDKEEKKEEEKIKCFYKSIVIFCLFLFFLHLVLTLKSKKKKKKLLG